MPRGLRAVSVLHRSFWSHTAHVQYPNEVASLSSDLSYWSNQLCQECSGWHDDGLVILKTIPLNEF